MQELQDEKNTPDQEVFESSLTDVNKAVKIFKAEQNQMDWLFDHIRKGK